MISLVTLSRGITIKSADYTLDKVDKFYDIIGNLTPKFKGFWEFVLIDPKLSFIEDMMENALLPDWVHITVYTSAKKVDALVIKYPTLQPKEVSKKDKFNDMLANLKHNVDERARKALYGALSHNLEELQNTLTMLDSECKTESITLKQVQSAVILNKKVYASDVVDAFLTHEKQRWVLYKKLLKELGNDMCFYAMRKYVTRLLKDKEAYLRNEEVKTRAVSKLPAPVICYAYTLFANASSPAQLPIILHALENRGVEWLSIFTGSDLSAEDVVRNG